MSHTRGAYLGSVRCISTLHARCYEDDITGCWHCRTAEGKAMPDSDTKLYVHGFGKIGVTRAAWMLHTCEPIPVGYRVYRTCESYDCANPQHLRCWTPKQWGRWMERTGRARSMAKAIANKLNGRKRSRLSEETRRWIVEAPLTQAMAAQAHGISTSYAGEIRRKAARAAFGVMR